MEARIIMLESKLALTEDQVDALNTSIYRQQQQIEVLQLQLKQLVQMYQELQQSHLMGNLKEQIPPHY